MVGTPRKSRPNKMHIALSDGRPHNPDEVYRTKGRRPMIVGYARTSTSEQRAGLDAQIRDLKAAGCEKIFSEQISSAVAQRPRLAECLHFLRETDTLMVTRPDRLARSTHELLRISEELAQAGIGLVIQSMGLDTRNGSNPTAKLMLSGTGRHRAVRARPDAGAPARGDRQSPGGGQIQGPATIARSCRGPAHAC